jgi:hypothetical protein
MVPYRILRHHDMINILRHQSGERITSPIDFIITHLIQGYVIQFHAAHLEGEKESLLDKNYRLGSTLYVLIVFTYCLGPGTAMAIA